MNKKLFMSILAMDSYNRGYGQGISGLSSIGLGLATFARESDILSTSPEVDAGFYAMAYDVSNVTDGSGGSTTIFSSGETVISYRGTNTTTSGDWGDDIANGWLVGAGSPAEAQAYYAVNFFSA